MRNGDARITEGNGIYISKIPSMRTPPKKKKTLPIQSKKSGLGCLLHKGPNIVMIQIWRFQKKKSATSRPKRLSRGSKIRWKEGGGEEAGSILVKKISK